MGKHARFAWSDLRQKAFEELETALLNPPVLRLANVDKEFRVVTDASDFALGAVCFSKTMLNIVPLSPSLVRNYPPLRKTIHSQREKHWL